MRSRYRMLITATVVFFAASPFAWSQTTTYATATVYLGNNSWSGVVIPGGLQSGDTTIFTGMKQAATVAPFCPSWVELWDGTGIDDGQAVSWVLDTPQGPGHYHSVYSGTFHVAWNWAFLCYTYSISYGVTTSYIGE